MKFLLLLVVFTGTLAHAQQQKVSYYLFNENWGAARDIATAAYVMQTTNVGDTLFINRTFRGSGVLWKQESFSDEDQTMPHGHFAWYDERGRIDSAGYVNQKRKDKTWTYYNDTLGVYLSVLYENGKVIERRDYVRLMVITPEGEKTFAADKEDKALAQQGGAVKDPNEKEAYFKGGAAGYKKYLERHINPPTNLLETGLVKLQFIVNTEGKVEDLLILKSLQLSADIEALRVLSEMPAWTPAYQFGKNVRYHAIQYLTFQVGR